MSEATDELAQRLAELHARARDPDPRARHAAMRARVLARTEEPARGGRLRMPAFAAAGLAMAVVVLLSWSAWRPTPLTFTTDTAPTLAQTQAFVVAEGEAVTVRFTDGGSVQVNPHAELRVGIGEGAELVLERGTIDARPGATAAGSWRIDAGPYRIAVLGDAVRVAWEPEHGRLELDPQQGRVEVRGPGIDGTRVLDGGERLVLGAPELHADATVVLAPTQVGPAPVAAVVTPTPERPARVRKSVPPTTTTDWRTLARAGNYPEALDAAETLGFAALCRSVDAEALLELADVGRYAKRPARATEALTALRRRFPGSDAAAAAAFDLGRMRANDCDGAREWFTIYLRERPGGAMAAAARRRIDECVADEAPSPP